MMSRLEREKVRNFQISIRNDFFSGLINLFSIHTVPPPSNPGERLFLFKKKRKKEIYTRGWSVTITRFGWEIAIIRLECQWFRRLHSPILKIFIPPMQMERCKWNGAITWPVIDNMLSFNCFRIFIVLLPHTHTHTLPSNILITIPDISHNGNGTCNTIRCDAIRNQLI